MESLLSTKDCDTILQNCLKRNNLKVSSYSVKSLSDKIEGFLGEHFFVTIEYEDKEGTPKSQRCFMKVLNGSSKIIFEISKSLNAYNKEEFFYTFLLNEFDKYRIDTSFTPRGYFCKPHLLVLEDLSQRNFVGYENRSEFLDLNHCKVGLKTLAKFHAAGLLYESAKSFEQGSPYSLVEKYSQIFQDMLLADDNNLANLWFKKSLEGVFALIPVIAEEYDVDKDLFTERLSLFIHEDGNFQNYLRKFKGTVLHGDLWFNNFLFKYESDIVTESILFDYQLLKYGPPSIDVLHFIYANTRKKMRDSHFNELIEFYYKELCSHKSDLHLFIPKDQYLKLCNNELQIMLKLQIICDRSITLLVDDTESVSLLKDEETLRLNMFQRRSERIIDSFQNNTYFKEVIAEDMLELYSMLNKFKGYKL